MNMEQDHDFRIVPHLCEGDNLVYCHNFIGSDGSRWTTEAAGDPHVNGYRFRILKKDGKYYAMDNAYVIPFACETGYEIVVEIPVHHTLEFAETDDGELILVDPDNNANVEFQKWYNALSDNKPDPAIERWLTPNLEDFMEE